MTDKSGAVFPMTEMCQQGDHSVDCPGHSVPGLTKRELFAAMAMQGMLSRPGLVICDVIVAAACVESADALLAELAKEKP